MVVTCALDRTVSRRAFPTPSQISTFLHWLVQVEADWLFAPEHAFLYLADKNFLTVEPDNVNDEEMSADGVVRPHSQDTRTVSTCLLNSRRAQ